MKPLQLIFGTSFLFFLLFMSVRFWGESQSYQAFESDFWIPNDQKEIVVIPWEQGFFLEKNPHWVLWADVYRGDNNDILVKPWIERKLSNKTLEKVSSPARPLLSELMQKYPNARWVINCNDNQRGIHVQLAQIISEASANKRVILQSDYNSILVSTKKESAMLLYGSSPADLTRLKSFDSLGLVAAAPFNGDVYFGPLTYLNRPTINQNISRELKKRFKKVFLGPLESEKDILKAKEIGADGFFIADPLLWPLSS